MRHAILRIFTILTVGGAVLLFPALTNGSTSVPGGERLTVSRSRPNGTTLYAASHSVTVTATVPPHREVVVDRNLRITKVVSNTTADTTPTFVLGNVGGTELKNCERCRSQYRQLSHRLDFSKIGTVYSSASR